MGDRGGADRGGERPLAPRRPRYRGLLPLVIAFAFLLSIILSQTQRIGDLVEQNSAPCPAASSKTDPSLKCQVEQLHKLLDALQIEPVPGSPGQVRVAVPTPVPGPVVVIVSPAPAPARSEPTRASPAARPRRTPPATSKPRPTARPTSSPSPTCTTVYNPVTGKCLT
jgi:hypothetical protein